MPIRMPEVNGTRWRPAASIISRRTVGFLSGEPKCAPPRSLSRGETVSSMMPCETLTLRSLAISCSVITPALTCGSSPVSFSTSAQTDSR